MDELFNLPAASSVAGNTEPATIPTSEPTAEQERQLRGIARAPISAWNTEIDGNILPAYERDLQFAAVSAGAAGVDSIRQTLAASASVTALAASATEVRLRDYFERLEEWHRRLFVESIRRSIRVDASTVLTRVSIQPQLEAVIQRNVGLIRGLDSDMRRTVERVVYDAYNAQDSRNRLRRRLKIDLGFAPARAKLIARDQLGKIAGEFDRIRHEQLGVNKFVWIHSLEENPRPEHLARHNQVFPWSRPPGGVIPGQEINCRCRAAAYVEPS